MLPLSPAIMPPGLQAGWKRRQSHSTLEDQKFDDGSAASFANHNGQFPVPWTLTIYIYIYQRHSAMFHGDAVNPRINHPQETWQNPRFLSTFMGDSWGFPFDPQLRRRFRTLPRLNRQRASQILDMLGITTEDRLFKSFQPPNVCWLNHPNCW